MIYIQTIRFKTKIDNPYGFPKQKEKLDVYFDNYYEKYNFTNKISRTFFYTGSAYSMETKIKIYQMFFK